MEFPTQFEDLAPVSCIRQDLFTLEQGVFKGVGVGGACTFLYNVDVGPRRDATKVPCGNNISMDGIRHFQRTFGSVK